MSTSFSTTTTNTFTITHAKRLASKVRTDLMRMYRYYEKPSIAWIDDYEAEITLLLKEGYLGTVTYGFKRDGKWISPTVRYTASELADGNVDDIPGLLPPRRDIEGASFSSYLTYSPKWNALTAAERQRFKDTLPVDRASGSEPAVDGYFSSDKVYAAGGRSLNRSQVKSY